MPLAADFSRAQRLVATAMGTPRDVATNTLFPTGEKALGVYGQPQSEMKPMPGGGYRKRTWIPLTITRDQLASAPDKSKLVRTDVTPPVTYVIDYVGFDRAYDYELHLVRYGE